MSWGTRQQRLRNLLGGQRFYVFQLFGHFEVWPIPLGMVMDLCRQHQLNFTKINRFEFPKQKIGPYEFDAGHIGQTDSRLARSQCLYTSYPYLLKDTESFMEADSLVIRNLYLAARTKAIPDFKSQIKANQEGLVAGFAYYVHEFDSRLFPQNDMGKLMPYTVIPGHEIRPEVEHFVDFSEARLDQLPFVSERPYEQGRTGGILLHPSA